MNKLLTRFMLINVLIFQSDIILADTQVPREAVNTFPKDFGKVEQGSVVTTSFELRNEGSSPLEIKSVEVSAPGMKVRTKQKLAPGDSTSVRVSLDTSHYSGALEEQALVYFNDTVHPTVLITLKGTVVPPIDISPIPAFYMSQFEGENKSRSLDIKNNQEHQVNITKVEVKGTHFVPRLETIEGGKNYKLWAEIPPSTAVGRYRESIILYTDDPEHPNINIEVNVLVKPDIHITPDIADFGSIDLSQVNLKPGLAELIKQSFIIKRRSGTMAITDIKSDIPFLDIRKMPSGKSKGFTVELSVDYKEAVLGTFSGTVTLITDDKEQPALEIPVLGIIR